MDFSKFQFAAFAVPILANPIKKGEFSSQQRKSRLDPLRKLVNILDFSDIG